MKKGTPYFPIRIPVKYFAALALIAAMTEPLQADSTLTNPPVVHASFTSILPLGLVKLEQGCAIGEGGALSLRASIQWADWQHPGTYQEWFHNGQPTGLGSTYYEFPSVSLSDAGEYFFVAGDTYGMSTSEVVRVTVAPTGPLDHWTDIRKGFEMLPQMCMILYGNAMYVAPGSDSNGYGLFLISSDGTNWVDSGTRMEIDFSRGTFANGRFVVLGRYQEDSEHHYVIVTSTDGLNWEEVWQRYVYSDEGNTPKGITWFNGRFIVSGMETDLVSTDGLQWDFSSNDVHPAFWGIAAGDGILLGKTDSGDFSLSPDGVHWGPVFRPADFTANNFWAEGVRFQNGLFFASGDSPALEWSVDGTNWHAAQLPTLDTNKVFRELGRSVLYRMGLPAYGPNGFVLLVSTLGFGVNGDTVGIDLLTSQDGKVWSRHDFPINTSVGVSYAGGMYFAVGAENLLFTSLDGVNWEQRSGTSTRTINSVAGTAAKGVAVGDFGLIMSSTDALHWKHHNGVTIENLNSVISYNGHYIAVGGISHPFIATSDDGENWETWSNTTGRPLMSVAAEGGEILAVGLGGTVVKRSGDVWTTTVAANAGDFMSVTRFANQWIAAANSCLWCYPTSAITFYSSSDGLTWTPRLTNNPTDRDFLGRSIFATTPDYVIASGLNQRFISSNGLDWVSLGSQPTGAEIVYGGGMFVTESGYLYSSTNGFDWVAHSRPGQNLLGFALGRVFCGTVYEGFFCSEPWNALQFHIGGEAGRVLRLQCSPDLRSWADMGLITNPPSLRLPLQIDPSVKHKFFRVVEP